MDRHFGRRAVLAVLVTFLAAGPAFAQLEANLSSLTEENAEGYLSPLPAALSATLNSGIFRSGDVPLTGLTFTLDIKAIVASFGDDEQTYTTADVPGFGTTEAPTVIGSTAGAVNTGGPGGAAITYPGGFDMEHFPLAVPQLTVGSLAGTRAMIRWIPSIDMGDSDIGEISFFGIGGQHSVSQYFPGLPVDMAAGIMYQKLDLGDVVNVSALALNVTGSKKFGVAVSIEPYVGLGIDSLKMDAEYDNQALGIPIDVDFDRENDIHMTLGTSVNFPGVKLHGELTNAALNCWAVGLSFGI
jgi:hypothetical protein